MQFRGNDRLVSDKRRHRSVLLAMYFISHLKPPYRMLFTAHRPPLRKAAQQVAAALFLGCLLIYRIDATWAEKRVQAASGASPTLYLSRQQPDVSFVGSGAVCQDQERVSGYYRTLLAVLNPPLVSGTVSDAQRESRVQISRK
jgi:hypothetical protein